MNAMRTRHSRGFTLVELLVSATVSAIVMSGVFIAVSAQQRAYNDGHRQRSAQASARDALMTLEQTISLAGFGMAGSMAFDFGRYVAPDGSSLRDSVNGPDELVVLHRDPNYWTPDLFTDPPSGHAWLISGLTPNNVTITARGGERFPAGQVLQAVCRGGGVYAYFTVSTSTAAATAPGPFSVPLDPAVADDPFRQQDWASDPTFAEVNGCFAAGQARLFLIQRSRFHVTPVATSGGLVPYLMLDHGVDANFDGVRDANDETVLAEGIESLQVAYVMNNSLLGVRGLSGGTAIAFPAGRPTEAASDSVDTITTTSFPGVTPIPTTESIYQASSFFAFPVGPPPSPLRLTDHQANIVAVRIGLVARSPDPQPDPTGGDGPRLLFNMSAQPSWIDPDTRYARTTIETSIPVRNTFVRGINDF